MYTRFPELVPPEISRSPTVHELESGEWCFPSFRPDESYVTMLDPNVSAVSQFADITPRYLWLQNDRQTIVAVSASHLHDPNAEFYNDLRSLYGRFVNETNNQERTTLKEGRLWPQDEVDRSDDEIIATGGDGLYLQLLAYRNGVECLSSEPVNDSDILAVMRDWPELSRAALMYVKMRMLPQAYKRQQNDTPYERISIVPYFTRFLYERKRHHGRSWTGNHLYSINAFWGPGCLDPIARHLSKAHGLRNDKGRALQGWEIAEDPNQEAIDQIFRCTNNPVFHAKDVNYRDLCEVQQVTVLVNRLRDRRMAYLLADLGSRAVSYFWMSGHPHYEALLPALRCMAAEQGLSSRSVHAELGLLAVQASDRAIGQVV